MNIVAVPQQVYLFLFIIFGTLLVVCVEKLFDSKAISNKLVWGTLATTMLTCFVLALGYST